MPISNSYPRGIPIEDQDLFVGTKAYNNRTVNYTAQGVADYLNINSKVAIGGQMSFQFTIVPNIPKTIAFEGGLGNNTAFSAITKLIVSAIDVSTANITIFLNYLNNSQVLLSQQNQPNFFGHYKITGYTQIGTSAFYELDLEFIGGNGTIGDKQYYDLVSFVLSTEVPPTEWGSITGDIEDQTDLIDYISSQITTPTLQQVVDEDPTITLSTQRTTLQAAGVTVDDTFTLKSTKVLAGAITMTIPNGGLKTLTILPPGDISEDRNITFPNASGTIALTSDIGTWGALNYPTWSTGTPFVKMTAAGTFALDTNTYVTTANLTLQNAYNNSTDATIILDATRGDVKVKSIAGLTKSMSFFDPLGNEVLTFHSEACNANIKRISANNNGFIVDCGSNIIGNNLTINDIYSSGDIVLSNDKSLISYSNILQNHYFKGTSGVKWESDVKIEYAADYSALYSNRSLVDKEYVDGLITGGTVTSVGLSMPSAFTVTNSPITSSGDITVTGAGLVSQYVRGDGTLANFPNSTGGGSSVNYYLNGSVSQGTFGGTTYYQMSKTPILGAGTNFTRTNGAGNGYIASFITDAGDPSFLNIPGGNWNLEFYFQSSSTGGSPQFYGEIYKVSATNVFTLVASGSTNPEGITNGTTVDQYFTSISVPQTSLLVTDRLAVRIYVITSGRTITLHTENGNLCEVLTTFTTGLTALNGLTQQVQYFDEGTSGTDFNISSSGDTHTFNLPTASATNRGALSSTDWTTFNNKQNSSTRRNANNSSNNNINYCGVALGTGISESSAVWTITRLTISASGAITIATATNVAWTNRESVIYT